MKAREEEEVTEQDLIEAILAAQAIEESHGMTGKEIAHATNLSEEYVREWIAARLTQGKLKIVQVKRRQNNGIWTKRLGYQWVEGGAAPSTPAQS